MNATFDQIARCFAAYQDLDSAFWPFIKVIYFNGDDVHNDPVASAEAMRRMLAITMAGGACGRLMWGLVSDLLLGRRRVVVLAIVGALTCATLALMTRLPSDAPMGLIAGLVFLVGITAFGWTAVWVVFAAELAGPALTGTTLGFSATIIGVATMLVPPLFGLVVDQTGSYDMGWWMLVGLAGTGTMVLAFLRPQSRKRTV